MLNIAEIKINHLTNPLGVKESFSIGWKIISEKLNTLQTSYEIQIAKDELFSDVLYTQSKQTDESVGVQIANLKLSSLTKYFIRIKISDNYKEISPWNETWFVTAILSDSECM